MLQIRNLDLKDVVHLLCDTKIRNDLFGVPDERFVDFQRGRSVNVRHFEVVLCGPDQRLPHRLCEQHSLTQNVDDTFVDGGEQDKQVLDD